MIKKIDVCIGNFTTGTGIVFEQLQTEFPAIQFRRWSCLGNCHNCYRKPFFLIDDTEIVEADTAEQLALKIKEFLS